jgi:hypothetical protein
MSEEAEGGLVDPSELDPLAEDAEGAESPDSSSGEGGTGKPLQGSELVRFYSDKLQFLWDRYLVIVHLLISLSGGTILVLLNILKMSDRAGTGGRDALAWFATITAGLSLVLALLWRFFAQTVMERQIYGPREAAQRYFRIVYARDDDDLLRPWAIRQDRPYLFERWYGIFKFPLILLLLTSWICTALWVLPATGSPSLPDHRPTPASTPSR